MTMENCVRMTVSVWWSDYGHASGVSSPTSLAQFRPFWLLFFASWKHWGTYGIPAPKSEVLIQTTINAAKKQ